MARPSKRKQHMRELAKERKRKRELASDTQEEHGWESSEVEEDVTAIGLLQHSVDLVLDEPEESEDEDLLVSEGEELEEVDKSAFGRLMVSAVVQSRYERTLKYPLPVHSI